MNFSSYSHSMYWNSIFFDDSFSHIVFFWFCMFVVITTNVNFELSSSSSSMCDSHISIRSGRKTFLLNFFYFSIILFLFFFLFFISIQIFSIFESFKFWSIFPSFHFCFVCWYIWMIYTYTYWNKIYIFNLKHIRFVFVSHIFSNKTKHSVIQSSVYVYLCVCETYSYHKINQQQHR